MVIKKQFENKSTYSRPAVKKTATENSLRKEITSKSLQTKAKKNKASPKTPFTINNNINQQSNINQQFTEDIIIGLEIHAEMNTDSKLFCSCPTRGSEEPNSRVCPTCLGHPGSKPVLNKAVIFKALNVALALQCDISPAVIFSRKSYFYPDMSKNYQITQYEEPLGTEGRLCLRSGKEVQIQRVHIEEDPASLVHFGAGVLIDYNRSGNPLVEIVTKPVMYSPDEARDFMKRLVAILEYLKVHDTGLSILKADANISIRESGYQRVEIKNITGFKEIESALFSEVARQKEIAEKGEKILQETRGWDAEHGLTYTLRSKETEADYGYIIDPDLVPFELPPELIEKVRKELPKLPQEKIDLIVSSGVKKGDAEVLAGDRELAELFDRVSKKIDPTLCAKWLRRELLRVLNYHKKRLVEVPHITSDLMIDFLGMIERDEITDRVGQKIMEILAEKPINIKAYIVEQGLGKGVDKSDLENECLDVIKENPAAVEDYLKGGEKSFNFLFGKVMQRTRGKADPKMIGDTLKRLIKK